MPPWPLCARITMPRPSVSQSKNVTAVDMWVHGVLDMLDTNKEGDDGLTRACNTVTALLLRGAQLWHGVLYER